MRVSYQEESRARHVRMTHTAWVEKVAFVCRTVRDDPATTYDRACRAVEKLYGPCPPKK